MIDWAAFPRDTKVDASFIIGRADDRVVTLELKFHMPAPEERTRPTSEEPDEKRSEDTCIR